MRIATVLAALILLVLDPGRVWAQAVEAGAGVAFSCKSTDRSPCTYTWGRVDAVHLNWWYSPSLVVEARGARLEGPRTRIVAVPETISPTGTFFRSYTLRDERRTLLQVSALYHFRPERTIRPFLGGGVGALWWRGEAFCDSRQIDCERVLPADTRQHAREWVCSFAAGLAVDAGHGVIVRSGVRAAAILPAVWRPSDRSVPGRATRGELPELFVSVGYRW